MRKQQNFQWDKISLGVCYYPEHWEKNLWREDLQRMKQHGIHTVRVAEFAWSVFESEEGVFQFDFFDEFLDLSQEEGMQVIFCTPTSIPPVWLTERYPEVLNARKDGVLYRHGMRRHYNYNSPVLQKFAARIVRKVAEHYAKRPCIVGWQIDNEFNCEIDEYHSESDTVAFRSYVKDKYKTLDELNKAWGTIFWNQTYTAWEQVYVPRTTINDMTNPHQMLDYTRFISESTIRFCRLQSDILRQYVKQGDFITTNGMFTNVDNHTMTDECLDVYCYDSYPNFAYALREDPKHNTTLNDRKWSRNLMEVRSICPHFGTMEQQSGANGWNTQMESPAPKPGQMMLWTMQSIMHGADYVSFFRWRTATFGTEMYWHGLLNYDNCHNRRLEELDRISERISKIKDLAGGAYVAHVGVLKDYDNIWDAQQDVWHGRLAWQSEMEIFVAAQISHTPLDNVYMQDATEPEELKKYHVLFCPHMEILTEKQAEILKAYVRNGGCLIIGARTGLKDSHGHCCMKPMPGLLADAAQTSVEDFTFVGPGDEPVAMSWGDKHIDTGGFNDILKVDGKNARVLAAYENNYYAGKPALVETKYGKGTILHYGGTFTRENTDAFLAYTGVRNPFDDVAIIPKGCELAVREKNGMRYLFILNYRNASEKIIWKREVTDLDTNEKICGEQTLATFGTGVYLI